MAFRKKTDDGAERLAGIALFEGFSPAELHRVAELVEEADAQAGAVLTEQGKPGQECFVIVTGEASVDVGTHRVATLGPGDLVGEMALIDNQPRSATVRAVTPMRLLALDATRFRTLLDELPKANRAIMAKLSEKLRADNQI
ncbi:MAG: cyclic nucleotide-binding domain-containing protein [Acidimicrobiales bacterium]